MFDIPNELNNSKQVSKTQLRLHDLQRDLPVCYRSHVHDLDFTDHVFAGNGYN